MQYNKRALTYSEQVALLESRGLDVPDKEKAEEYLSQISYYRLSAYFLPFQLEKNKFNTGTVFDTVLDLYSFDRDLRLLAFDAIERIEVAIRCQMIYQLSNKYGSHWQDENKIFRPPYFHKGKTTDVFTETQKIIIHHRSLPNPEVFIAHYVKTYTSPCNPPSWMCLELLTIGELSRLYKALNSNQDKKDIAAYFRLHHKVFTSWLHTLVYVRNLCAHHGRLWNRDFAIKPDVLLKPQLPWLQVAFNDNSHRTFYFFSILKYLLLSANPSGHFKEKLEALIKKHPTIPIRFMGIPTDGNGVLVNWQNEPLWQK